MPAIIFDTLLKLAISKGITNIQSKDASKWFRAKAKTTGKGVTPNQILRDTDRHKSTVQIGSMYYFSYDPKTKKKLPFYDRFPLVFPIEPAPGGFIGINLHYLPPALRAQLMDALMSLQNTKTLDEKTKLNISYNILKRAGKFKAFRPTVKRYLNSHVQSQFIKIDAAEWNIALFLPTERFMKASKKKVWADSRSKI